MDADALQAFLVAAFPAAATSGVRVDEVEPSGVTISLHADAQHLRPGGTVSGPVVFTLIDTAAYLVLLSRLGPVALAVTTSADVHFLRKGNEGALRARASIVRLGRRLAVVHAEVCSGADPDPIAIATVTYALP